MDRSDDQLVANLKNTLRCRPDIKQLAEQWSGLAPARYDALAEKLCEQGEAEALGILLNVAAVNQVRLNPAALAGAFETADNVIDLVFPCRFQDQDAIGPLLEAALAENISWERQALAALLATELTVKFDQPKQTAQKVLWRLSKEIFAPEAVAMVHTALYLLESDDPSPETPNWLTSRDILRELPRKRPHTVIGGSYTVRRSVPKLGRNDPCHCGSGKKYKKCCYDKDQERLRDASGYAGLTNTQLRETPSLVEDTAPIKTMRFKDLKDLVPATLNDDQLFAAYRRAEGADLRELAYAMLLELKERPGKEDFAVEHLSDLFEWALNARDIELAERVAQHIPPEDLYHTGASRFQHALLKNPEPYADLEALCRRAMQESTESGEHPLLELSYAFDSDFPALSLVFGRAAIVSEPRRTFDNEVLFELMEKNRIALDLEPWGDPIEEFLDWASEEETPSADKDRKIEQLETQLAAAREKSAQARKKLQRKERQLAALEARRKDAANEPKATQPAPAVSGAPLPPDTEAAEKNRQQIQTLRGKIETLKDEIRCQQASRQELRGQLRDAHQKIAARENQQQPTNAPLPPQEDGIAPEQLSKQIRIPECSDTFRKSCEKLPAPVVAKALRAAAGFAAMEEATLRQTAALERLPDTFRIRVGIHYRLLVRLGLKNTLEVLDLIPRQDLETWIRQHSA
jgi:hypothetical protein